MARLASISRTIRPQIGTAIVAVLNHPSVDWPPWLIGCTGPRKGRWSPTSTVNNKTFFVTYLVVGNINYAKRIIIHKFNATFDFRYCFKSLARDFFRIVSFSSSFSLYLNVYNVEEEEITKFKEIDIIWVIKLKGRRTKLCYSFNIDTERGERDLY